MKEQPEPESQPSMKEPETYSLMELRGLGKELWQREDAVEYVARERGDWGSG